jgi:DNA mismatch repair protein MutL
MARVHLLDDELINKIAAGEVVERPASVVKELVENAIDAGASHVRVSLKDGGRELIHVQDDGIGLERDDAILAVKRHTTSKLTRADDLFSVATLGFRGEALASISSVSRFTLQTQPRESSGGVRLSFEDGVLQETAWQGPYGTSVIVADLFYNVPARKSFLKTAAAEFAACHEYMQALALSLPHLGFTLLHNDREIFNLSPLPIHSVQQRGEQALRQRAQDLFGEAIAAPLVYVTRQDRYANIEALFSPPGHDRGSAKFLFTFVNRRWVRDKLIRFGIMRGYHSHLLKGKFPIAFLHLDLDPGLVDVNVHPAKAELRFQYGNEVQNVIAMAIREGLRQGNWAKAPSARDVYASQAASAQDPSSAGLDGKGQTREAIEPLPPDFDLALSRSDAAGPTLGVGQDPSSTASSIADFARALEASAREQKNSSLPSVRQGARAYSPTAPSDAAAMQTGLAPTQDGEKQITPQVPLSARDRLLEDALQPDSVPAKNRGSADTIKRTIMSFDAPKGLTRPSEPPPLSSLLADSLRRGPDSSESSSGLKGTEEPNRRESVVLPSHPSPSLFPPRPSAGQADRSLSLLREERPPLEVDGRLDPAIVLNKKSEGVDSIPWSELQYIGAFARCYLLFEYRHQMLAVDQHAFHERILYERLSQNPQLLMATQPLLIPEVLAFRPTELVVLAQQQAEFARYGLHYQVISDTEIEIVTVPSLLVHRDLPSLVQALLDGAQSRRELAHDVLATMACHAAVRAGEDLPEAELKALVSEASRVDFYHNCPHGRRVFRWWKESQVAAWFDRLS